MAVTNVLCTEDLKDRRECGYIADDTRKKFNADFGSVLSVRVVLGSQPNVDAATQQVIAPFVGTILVEFADQNGGVQICETLRYVTLRRRYDVGNYNDER